MKRFAILLFLALAAVPAGAQPITTCREVYEVMNTRDLDGADEELGRRAGTALSVACLAQRYGPRWANTGYMKQGDHRFALIVLLGREPTYLEVFDSWIIQGSTNINAARNRVGYDVTGRPTNWEHVPPEHHRLHVLIKLYGASRGSRIFDGAATDPDPAKTAELLALWRGTSVPVPEPPPPAPTPNPEPGPDCFTWRFQCSTVEWSAETASVPLPCQVQKVACGERP